MKNTKFTIGQSNENSIELNVVVTQKSISMRNGVELESHFKGTFNVYVNKYVNVGQSLSRILKAMNYQIIQGKKSGKFSGLNLRSPFKFVVKQGDQIVFTSKESQFDAKCGLTEKSQNRFFHGFAEQFAEKFNNTTLAYMNNESANYTIEDDHNNFRSIMDTNIVEALETLYAFN